MNRRGMQPYAMGAGFILFVLPAVFVGLGLSGFSYDDAFIIFHYAENWALHGELQFNPGERVYGVTAPFYALLLGMAGRMGADIPATATWLSAISLLVFGLMLFKLLRSQSRTMQWAVSVGACWLVMFLPWNIELLGTETLPQLACVTAGCCLLFETRRETAAGLAFAGAILLRPDALIAAGSAWIIYSMRSRRISRRFFLACGLPTAAWLGWTWLYYGELLPHTLHAKQMKYEGRQLVPYGFETWRWMKRVLPAYGRWVLVVGALAGLVALVRRGWWKHPVILSAGSWILLHEAAYRWLNVAFAPWYEVGTVAVAVVLFCVGAWLVSNRLLQGVRTRLVLYGLFMLPVLVPSLAFFSNHWKNPPDPRFHIYQEIGCSLRDAPDRGSVAAAEIGLVGYFSRRPVLDLIGLVSPEVVEARKQARLADLFFEKEPAYLVYADRFSRGLLEFIVEDPRFKPNYALYRTFNDAAYSGPVLLYRRKEMQ